MACFLVNHIPSKVLDGQYIPLFFIPNMNCFLELLEFSIVYILFMIIVRIKPNWIIKLSNVYFGNILEVKKDISATVLICIRIWSPEILSPHHNLEESSMSTLLEPKNVFMSNKTRLHLLMWILCLYTRWAKFTIDVLVGSVTSITDAIRWEC